MELVASKLSTAILVVIAGALFTSQAMAGACCNVPTVWTLKNLDSVPVNLTCQLVKSVAWSGKPIEMETGVIAPAGSFQYSWGTDWYSDGMGMIPGSWTCQIKFSSTAAPTTSVPNLSFSTDWGENVTITWKKEQLTVARISTKKK